MPDDLELAFDPNASPYGEELAQAPAEPTPAPAPPPPGASRQAGYGDTTPSPPPERYGPPAPTRTLGGVDVTRLPFKPSAIDFNDDEEHLKGLRGDYDRLKGPPLLRDGSPAPQATPPDQHPAWQDYIEKERMFQEGLRNKTLKDPTEVKDLRRYLDNMRKQIELESRTEGKKLSEERKLEIRRNDEQRMTPIARAKTLDMVDPYVQTFVGDQLAKAQTGDPDTKRKASYTQFVSPLTTMSRKKPDGTVDYSLLRDTAAQLLLLNPHLNNPETAVQAVMAMATPKGFDDNGKAIVGANNVKGKGATAYQVLGRDEVNPKYVVVRIQGGPTLAVDPDTLSTIEKARIAGYNAIPKWEEDQAKANAPNILERAIDVFRR